MRKTLRMLAAIAVVASCVVFVPASGQAAGGVQLVTPYPGVVVGAGKTVNLTIQVTTPTRRRVDLAVVQAPGGWQTTFRGGGFVVSSVFGGPDDPPDAKAPEVTLEVKVPPDVGEGDYPLAVRGTSPQGGSDTLNMTLKVSQKAAGAVTFTTDFPTLRGKSDTTFTFKLTLNNNTPDATSFELSAQGPPGWRVDAKPQAETRAATVKVEGGGTASVDVEADPPDQVAAGSFPITVAASGGGDKRAEIQLTAEVTGTTQMELTTLTERLNAKGRAGKPARVVLVVRNQGTGDLRDVSLTNSAPTGWQVKFSPERVQQVGAKKTRQVTAIITPAAEAVAGDYSITVTATAEGSTSSKEIRFAVQTSPFWGLVGLLVIAGAVWGLFRVFRAYGRR